MQRLGVREDHAVLAQALFWAAVLLASALILRGTEGARYFFPLLLWAAWSSVVLHSTRPGRSCETPDAS